MPLAIRHAVVWLLLVSPALSAADWPRFRGPNGTGIANEPGIPLNWSKTENILWKTEVPGVGHSSPIVVKGKVFLQSSSEDASRRMLQAFDAATGKPLWTKEVPASRPNQAIHKKSSLASSTPASDGERVFVVFWEGPNVSLRAYDLEGTELWTASLGGFVSQHGVGLSPVTHGGKVFLNYDQDDPANAAKGKGPATKPTLSPGQGGWAEVLAFDAKTGARVWSAKRRAFRSCPSTPFIRELPNGGAELVVGSTAGLTGYDPESGKVNWDWTWKHDVKPLRTVGSPVTADGAVMIFSGDGDGTRGAAVVTPGSDAKVLWKISRGPTPYVPGPLARGSHLYWVADDGQATCVEARTGKIAWQQRVFNGGVTASPVLIGNAIVAVAENGKAVAFAADPAGYDELGTGDVGEPVSASPAVADGKLFIRGTTHLFCIGKK